jgi:hypothetical protein
MRFQLFGLVRSAVLIGAAAGGLVLACSSFSSDNGAGPADEAGADAATSDAPSLLPGDAANDAFTEAAALLVNGGFEAPGSVACAPGWNVVEGSATTAAGLGFGGSVGCLLCNNKALPGNGSLVGVSAIPNPPRGSYTLQAWVRQGPDGGAMMDYLALTATLADGGSVQAVPDQSPLSVFAAQSATLDVPAGATSLAVGLKVYANAGGCVVFDDAILTHYPPQ